MNTKATTTTTNASAEVIKLVQGIKDDDGGSSILRTGLVDWQRKLSVDFPDFRLLTVTLSRLCLVYNGGGAGVFTGIPRSRQ